MVNNYLSQLNVIKADNSRQVITILRSIILSYCALAWAQFWFEKSSLCILVIISAVLYFIVDITSYMASMMVSRLNFLRFESREITKKGVKISMRRLDKFTYSLLWIRCGILLADTVLLMLVFLKYLH